MNIEQALQIIDQLIAMAPVNRTAHAQGIEAMKLISAELLKKQETAKKAELVKNSMVEHG